MNPQISTGAFDTFFAFAPWVIGIIIYLAFFVAKRHEGTNAAAVEKAPTFSCSQCGRRGALDQMVAQEHGGAVSYVCAQCATATTAAAH